MSSTPEAMTPETRTPKTRRLVGALLLGAALTFVAVTVRAQAGGPAVPPVGPPNLDEANLDLRWRAFQRAEPNSQAEADAIDALLDAKHELGVPNLPHHAVALLRQAAGERDRERAERLLMWARELAPSLPDPDFVEAAMSWSTQPWAVPKIVSRLVSGYRLSFEAPSDARSTELHLRKLLLWILVGLVGLVALVRAIRSIRLIAYDVASITGHIISVGLAGGLVVVALLLPAVLLASPLLLGLLLIAVLLPYGRPTEQLVSLFLVACVAFTPTLVGRMGVLVAAADGRDELLYQAQYHYCDRRCRGRLDAIMAEHPEDQQAAFSAALVDFRRGTRRSLVSSSAILVEWGFHPDWTEVDLLEGTVLAALGYLSEARRLLQPVADSAEMPYSAVAHLNLAQILGHLGDSARAQEHLDRAAELELAGLTEFMESSQLRTNRWLMSVGAPIARLRGQVERVDSEADRAAGEIWAPFGGGFSRGAVVPACLFIAVVFAVGFLMRRQLRVSKACPTCGQVMSSRDAPTSTEAGYCPDCYDLFMMGANLATDARRDRELRVERYAQLRSRLAIGCNIVVPGLGFLLRGWALFGFPLLLLAVAGVVVGVCESQNAATFDPFGRSGFDGRVLFAFLLLGLAYVGGWVLTWVRRRQLQQ